MYKRITKDIYNIIWNGEIIDSFDTYAEAKEMKKEYAIAFHTGSITIKKTREYL